MSHHSRALPQKQFTSYEARRVLADKYEHTSKSNGHARCTCIHTCTSICVAEGGPTGTTMRPPTLSCETRLTGILSAAAPTWMASYGPCSAHPFHPSPVLSGFDSFCFDSIGAWYTYHTRQQGAPKGHRYSLAAGRKGSKASTHTTYVVWGQENAQIAQQ